MPSRRNIGPVCKAGGGHRRGDHNRKLLCRRRDIPIPACRTDRLRGPLAGYSTGRPWRRERRLHGAAGEDGAERLFGEKEGKISGNIRQIADTQIRITRSKAKTDTTETDSRTSLRSVAHLLFLLKQRPEGSASCQRDLAPPDADAVTGGTLSASQAGRVDSSPSHRFHIV